jgi:transposase
MEKSSGLKTAEYLVNEDSWSFKKGELRGIKNEIYISKDNFKGMQALFGKSIAQAGLGKRVSFIAAQSQSCGRQFKEVSVQFTTQTCHSCWSRTGLSGLKGCEVRTWECGVILRLGQGMASAGNESSYKVSWVKVGLKSSQKPDPLCVKTVQSA